MNNQDIRNIAQKKFKEYEKQFTEQDKENIKLIIKRCDEIINIDIVKFAEVGVITICTYNFINLEKSASEFMDIYPNYIWDRIKDHFELRGFKVTNISYNMNSSSRCLYISW